MTAPIQAYPLQWPPGWRRADRYARKSAKFGKVGIGVDGFTGSAYRRPRELTISDGVDRILDELHRMGVAQADIAVSTNVPVGRDGFPLSKSRVPEDPGVAVYWNKGKTSRCMAVDQYDRVADNLAAIAATLDAMRAIERHGGAAILDRAFIGFAALPAPEQWFTVLGTSSHATKDEIEEAFRRKAMQAHPDRGGNSDDMARINQARDDGLAQIV